MGPGEQPLKLPLPLWDLHPHLMHGSFGHSSQHPKRHLDRLVRFCRSHEIDQQTDRQTDRQTVRYSVCSTAMLPKTRDPSVLYY